MPEAAFHGPAGFDAYWDDVLAEMDSVPAEPEIEAIPLRETDFATMSGVRLTSIGPYRLYGYLGVPKGDGPFPALYWPPKYMSVHQMIPQGSANAIRSRFVTFSLAGRGQRNADKPFAAMFPGLLTEGIESPATYIIQGDRRRRGARPGVPELPRVHRQDEDCGHRQRCGPAEPGPAALGHPPRVHARAVLRSPRSRGTQSGLSPGRVQRLTEKPSVEAGVRWRPRCPTSTCGPSPPG